jgi:hypothetical protein
VAGLSNKCAKRCCRGAALIGVQESKPFGIIRTCCINLHQFASYVLTSWSVVC